VIGDCWHRFFVRMREVVESVGLVRQALDRYEKLQAEWLALQADHDRRKPTLTPDEAKAADAALAEARRAKYAHRVEPPRALPGGEVYVETECPRGQMGFYVVGRPSKENVPLRVRARSSCLANLSVTDALCRGGLLADVPAIVGSLDIVMGEIDR
jgi:NADH-quinone oxidoreductase subunit D